MKTRVDKGHIGNAVRNEVDFFLRHAVNLMQELRAARAHYYQSIGQAGDFFQYSPLVRIRLAQNGVQGCDNGHAQLTQQGQNVTAGAPTKNPIFVLEAHEVYVVDVQEVGRAEIRVYVLLG